MRISSLHIHPVKSLPRVTVNELITTDRGARHDRRWMLVDERSRFITQRERPDLVHFTMQLNSAFMTVGHPEATSIEIPLSIGQGDEIPVQIFSDNVRAIVGAIEWNQWFSEILDQDVRLVFMPDSTEREVDPVYAKQKALNSFSDGYPYMVLGRSSLDDLNARLDTPLPMDRFRPNIVFEGGSAFCEDDWTDVRIGTATFRRVKPCARCVIITTDQRTGERGKEPTKTLSTYRKHGNQIHFGQNLICIDQGVLRVGDVIELQ